MESRTKSPTPVRGADVAARVDPARIPQLVAGTVGNYFYPSDDDPLPHGPWDPVIREVFRLDVAFGPQPEPSRSAARGGLLDAVALNPQPLPPRATFVAALGYTAILRAELLGDVAKYSGGRGAAGAYLADLLDDWCGTPPRKFPWPRPKGRPDWAGGMVTPIDHLVLAAVFGQARGARFSPEVSEGLAAGQKRLVETALGGLSA